MPSSTIGGFSSLGASFDLDATLTIPTTIAVIHKIAITAAYTIFAGCMLVSCLQIVILYAYAEVKTAIVLGSLVATLLVGMAFIAIGVFVSALTENQLAAAIGTIAIIAVFLLIGLLSSLFPSSHWFRMYVLNFISILTRFQGFANGYFDIASLVYYLSISAVFLYLTVRVYDRRRCG